VPPGFDANAARQGILNAMGFGEPTRTDDKAWFYFPKGRARTPSNSAVDQDGVPFDPDVVVATTDSKARLQVSCAVEYIDIAETVGSFGGARPARIKITLMDPEYQQVKGFSYVVAGGDKYLYDSTEPPVALGTIDIWTVHCTAEDEA
jgi:hypothetical protein